MRGSMLGRAKLIGDSGRVANAPSHTHFVSVPQKPKTNNWAYGESVKKRGMHPNYTMELKGF